MTVLILIAWVQVVDLLTTTLRGTVMVQQFSLCYMETVLEKNKCNTYIRYISKFWGWLWSCEVQKHVALIKYVDKIYTLEKLRVSKGNHTILGYGTQLIACNCLPLDWLFMWNTSNSLRFFFHKTINSSLILKYHRLLNSTALSRSFFNQNFQTTRSHRDYFLL